MHILLCLVEAQLIPLLSVKKHFVFSFVHLYIHFNTEYSFNIQYIHFNIQYWSVNASIWKSSLWTGYNICLAPSLTTEYEWVSDWSRSVMSTLCNPMDCSPPSSSVHGIFQARILEWVAISFSRGSSWPRDQTQVSCIAGRCFTTCAIMEAPFITRQGYNKVHNTCSFFYLCESNFSFFLNIIPLTVAKF